HEHYASAVVVQDQLKKLGMEVTLEAFDWATSLEKTNDKDAYDIFIYGYVPVPDPTSNTFLIDDFAGWTESDELNQLLKDIRSEPTLDDAKELYDDLQNWYWEYMPVVIVGDYDGLVAVRDNIKGYD